MYASDQPVGRCAVPPRMLATSLQNEFPVQIRKRDLFALILQASWWRCRVPAGHTHRLQCKAIALWIADKPTSFARFRAGQAWPYARHIGVDQTLEQLMQHREVCADSAGDRREALASVPVCRVAKARHDLGWTGAAGQSLF